VSNLNKLAVHQQIFASQVYLMLTCPINALTFEDVAEDNRFFENRI